MENQKKYYLLPFFQENMNKCQKNVENDGKGSKNNEKRHNGRKIVKMPQSQTVSGKMSKKVENHKKVLNNDENSQNG
jgi:hypothetical protein